MQITIDLPDDESAELVLASLRTSLQQIKEGKLHSSAGISVSWIVLTKL